jgi:hypothetical protein
MDLKTIMIGHEAWYFGWRVFFWEELVEKPHMPGETLLKIG